MRPVLRPTFGDAYDELREPLGSDEPFKLIDTTPT
jgi:hypothetical protein